MINHQNLTNDWGSVQSAHYIQIKPLHITKENKIIYLTVVWMLGMIVLISMFGMIYLAYLSKEVPQALIALGSVAVGALGSLFTHSK